MAPKSVLLVEPEVKMWTVKKTALAPHAGLLSLASYARDLHRDIEFSFVSLQLNRHENADEDFEGHLRAKKPDVVATTCITSSYCSALEIARTAKAHGVFVVMGGIFPSQNWQWILAHESTIDCIVLGEGEETFAGLLRALLTGGDWHEIPGIAFRDTCGRIGKTKTRSVIDPTRLAAPAYDLAPLERYRSLGVPLVIETTRGCPYNCAFCTLSEVWLGYREKPIAQVITELDHISSRYRFSTLKICDNNIALRGDRIIDLCKEIVRHNLKLSFVAETRIDQVDQGLLEIMCNAGIGELIFGVESVNEQILKSMNKRLDLGDQLVSDAVIANLAVAASVGLTVRPIFMLGWPGESLKSLKRTEEFVVSLHEHYGILPFLGFVTPHPGSSLSRAAPELGLRIVTEDLNMYTHLLPVAYPASLGKRGLEVLAETYNRIASATESEEYNPLIDLQSLPSLSRHA